jgi:hypothetical protein
MEYSMKILSIPNPLSKMPLVRASRINLGRSLFGAFLVLNWLALVVVHAGTFVVWTEPAPALVFSGENRSVRLFIKNSNDSAVRLKVDTRLYQVATAVAAPLGERAKWKELVMEAGQTIVEEFPISLPAVRTATSFLVKFYEEGRDEEIGSVSLLAYPEDLLSELKEVAKTHQVVLVDEENLLAPTLTNLNFEVVRGSLDERAQSDKPILLIVVAPKGSDFKRASEDLSKWTAGVLWVRRPSPLKLDELPMEEIRKGGVSILAMDRSLLDNFKQSPSAQLNLLRGLRRILKTKASE